MPNLLMCSSFCNSEWLFCFFFGVIPLFSLRFLSYPFLNFVVRLLDRSSLHLKIQIVLWTHQLRKATPRDSGSLWKHTRGYPTSSFPTGIWSQPCGSLMTHVRRCSWDPCCLIPPRGWRKCTKVWSCLRYGAFRYR